MVTACRLLSCYAHKNLPQEESNILSLTMDLVHDDEEGDAGLANVADFI